MRRTAGAPASPYGERRGSAQRTALARAAESLGGAFTVEELVQAARDQGATPGTATAYRAVRAMVESGFLEAVGERDGRALYARCAADDHHHHLVCTSCGAVAAAACPVDRLTEAAAAAAGFEVTGHEMVLYGLCRRCRPGPPDADGTA